MWPSRFLRVVALLLGPALGLVSCVSPAYQSMKSEDEMPELAPLKAKTRAAGNDTFCVPVTAMGVTTTVAVHQVGNGRRGRALVFVHGVLSDDQTWRFIAGELARDYDLYLLNLPGCGDSPPVAAGKMPKDFFTPSNLAEIVLQTINDILRRRHDSPELTLVAHSLGGAVALQMFRPDIRSRYRNAVSHVDRLVLFAPCDIAQPKQDADLKRIGEASSWKIQLARSMGRLRAWNAEAMLESMVRPENVPREEADRGVEMLADRGRREVSQAMVTQAVPWTKEGRPDWPQIKQLTSAYSHVRVPCLIVWGERDETLSQAMGYKLAAQLPRAKLVIVPETMHSLHLERPQKAVSLIRGFVSGSG
jgi:pimeloyl-ACP methyl ester carboxylesterase